MENLYQVIVNRFGGKCLIINLCDTEEEMQKMTVLQLKEKMIQQYPECRQNIENSNCYLIFGDVALEDSEPLSEYGIQHLSVIDVMVFQSKGHGHDEVDKDHKGDKKDDRKHYSMEFLANFREDGFTPKKEKEKCAIL
ncbi:hypothetical protein OJAV_G00181190 [Oryzias javanicus]|uniref:Ubiquitin-like domain-containing protein n=1 Tax=Oryzias javanicus TaxID=123683 RepID=A0A3S2LSV9_ORYJA|nr:hypothetical protein OJAV_G00181190 [Oryzias javanicus]